MNRNSLKMLSFPLIAMLAAGCATTRPRPAAQDANSQLAALQTQIQAKDQEIQDLHSQLDSRDQALTNNFVSTAPSDKFNILRVSGVSNLEVQKALLRAGFDPGPLDGRLGKKTRSAVKAFQRKNHLTADGVIGDRTWAALRAA